MNEIDQTHRWKVIVVGDLAIDWFQEPIDGVPRGENVLGPGHATSRVGWQNYETPGGALLTSTAIGEALGSRVSLRSTLDFLEPESLNNLRPALAHGLVELVQPERRSGCRARAPEGCRRVSRFRNFAPRAPGHTAGSKVVRQALELLKAAPFASAKADILVVDDAGWQFAHGARELPGVEPDGLFVLKLSGSLADAERQAFWARCKAQPEGTLVVVTADDLRQAGIDISRRLSWDRTMANLSEALRQDPAIVQPGGAGLMRALTTRGTVLVRFDMDGVALIRPDKEGGVALELICDAAGIEEEFARSLWRASEPQEPSYIVGTTAVFLSGLLRSLLDRAPAVSPREALSVGLADAVEAGLFAARAAFVAGMVAKPSTMAVYPNWEQAFKTPKALAEEQKAVGERPAIVVPLSRFDEPFNAATLVHDPKARVPTAALRLIRNDPQALDGFPRLVAGSFISTDPDEIASYRWIADLMERHLAILDPPRPLCLAVFGSPGSGKSFGVKQIAAMVGGGRLVSQEVNVAQLTSLRDLTRELHSARDKVLEGKVPLVFFDEFDSKLGDAEMGWLRFFLAPMQDGLFNDEGRQHSLKRAIFVFAGGTKARMSDFAPTGDRETRAGEGTHDGARELRRSAKVPDFVSRLRGYLDIKGPDDTDLDGAGKPRLAASGDLFWPLRRGMIIAHMLDQVAPNLRRGSFDAIAEPVLSALLTVPFFRHGARSIEAIIRMSSLQSDSERFDISMLPPDEQIELHTELEHFNRILRGWKPID